MGQLPKYPCSRATHADVIAIARYFGSPAAADPAQTFTSDQVVDQMLANITGDVKTWRTTYGALAKKYSLKRSKGRADFVILVHGVAACVVPHAGIGLYRHRNWILHAGADLVGLQ